MRFATPRRRGGREAEVVPMINVAFLLLIFFLLVAEIAPPEPFPVDPPQGAAAVAEPVPDILWVAADGTLAYGAARGEADVMAALAANRPEPLRIRADGGLPGADLARLVIRLSAMGISHSELALSNAGSR